MFGWFAKLFRPAPPPSAVRMGRNDPCWCGSGKKYKKCHFESDQTHFANNNHKSCTATS